MTAAEKLDGKKKSRRHSITRTKTGPMSLLVPARSTASRKFEPHNQDLLNSREPRATSLIRSIWIGSIHEKALEVGRDRDREHNRGRVRRVAINDNLGGHLIMTCIDVIHRSSAGGFKCILTIRYLLFP